MFGPFTSIIGSTTAGDSDTAQSCLLGMPPPSGNSIAWTGQGKSHLTFAADPRGCGRGRSSIRIMGDSAVWGMPSSGLRPGGPRVRPRRGMICTTRTTSTSAKDASLARRFAIGSNIYIWVAPLSSRTASSDGTLIELGRDISGVCGLQFRHAGTDACGGSTMQYAKPPLGTRSL
jgi:hypothetical protein